MDDGGTGRLCGGVVLAVVSVWVVSGCSGGSGDDAVGAEVATLSKIGPQGEWGSLGRQECIKQVYATGK